MADLYKEQLARDRAQEQDGELLIDGPVGTTQISLAIALHAIILAAGTYATILVARIMSGARVLSTSVRTGSIGIRSQVGVIQSQAQVVALQAQETAQVAIIKIRSVGQTTLSRMSRFASVAGSQFVERSADLISSAFTAAASGTKRVVFTTARTIKKTGLFAIKALQRLLPFTPFALLGLLLGGLI